MNILRLLEDHLPAAIEELDEKITEAYNTVSLLESRRLQLQRIAHAAGISINDAPARRENYTDEAAPRDAA